MKQLGFNRRSTKTAQFTASTYRVSLTHTQVSIQMSLFACGIVYVLIHFTLYGPQTFIDGIVNDLF